MKKLFSVFGYAWLVIFGIAALAAIVMMLAIAAGAESRAVIELGDLSIPANAVWTSEWFWVPVVFVALTFAFVIAAIGIFCALAVAVLGLACAAVLLASPLLLLGGFVWLCVFLVQQLWKNGHDAPGSTLATQPRR